MNELVEIIRGHAATFSDELRILEISRTGRCRRHSYQNLVRAINERAGDLRNSLYPGMVIKVAYGASHFGFIVDYLACLEAELIPIACKMDGQIPGYAPPAGAVLRNGHLTLEPVAVESVRSSGALLQMTSGTVRKSKIVAIPEASLLFNLQVIHESLQFTSSDVFCTWLPPFHDMGLVGGLLEPLFLGAKLVCTNPKDFLLDPCRWLRRVGDQRGSVIGMPAFGYRLCAARSRTVTGLDLSAVRRAIVGAEPVHANTLLSFANRFTPAGFSADAFRPCYGLAECTLLVTATRSFNRTALLCADEPIVSSGCSVRGTEIAIVDENDRPIRKGLGEICIASCSKALGYWNGSHFDASAFETTLVDAMGERTPFFKTGDIGYVRDGALSVLGRLGDEIQVRGRAVALAEIEAVVYDSVPSCVRCAAVADHSIEHPSIRIFLESDENNATKAESFAKATKLVKGKFGPRLKFVSVRRGWIPTTSSGKPKRTECLAKLEGEEIEPVTF